MNQFSTTDINQAQLSVVMFVLKVSADADIDTQTTIQMQTSIQPLIQIDVDTNAPVL